MLPVRAALSFPAGDRCRRAFARAAGRGFCRASGRAEPAHQATAGAHTGRDCPGHQRRTPSHDFRFCRCGWPEFHGRCCPKTAAFFKSALQPDLAYFNKLAKNHWNRPRLYIDKRIHSLFVEGDGSYPSGHSIRATLFAEVLASLLPQDRDALIARSQQVGWDREIAGVHFPSDIFAGRVLGHALANALLANPEIRAAR